MIAGRPPVASRVETVPGKDKVFVAKAIRRLQDIVDLATDLTRRHGPCPLAVAVAQDANILGAVVAAHHQGWVKGTLFGDRDKMERLAAEESLSLDGLELIHLPDDSAAAQAAVEAVAAGRARLIMKGFVKTAELLRLVLAKDYGLRGSGLLSHVAVMEVPVYPKLFILTDGGMVIRPSIEEKITILGHAADVRRVLGVRKPRVAILSMSDEVHPGLETTLENASIGKMGDRRQFPGLIVDGPISFDTAFSKAAAGFNRISSPVCGQTDILVVNSIEEGNTLIKSLAIFAGAAFAGAIVGAKVPIPLVSRTDSLFNKKASIALGVVLADRAGFPADDRASRPGRKPPRAARAGHGGRS